MRLGWGAIVGMALLAGCRSGVMFEAMEVPGVRFVYDSGGCGAPPDTVRMDLVQDAPEGNSRRNHNSNIDLGIGYADPASPTLQIEINLRYPDGVPEFEFLGDEILLGNEDGPAGTVPISALAGAVWELDGNRYPFVPWFEQEALEDIYTAHGNFVMRLDRTPAGKVDAPWILLHAQAPFSMPAGEVLRVDLPPIRFNGEIVDLPPAEFRKTEFSGPLGFNACKVNRAGI
ncbi:MAG: hypothetical protein KDA53_13820 [Hyphomonas sp.]|nr:hypothetical protein [Hyphomonas sp.]